MTRCRRLAGGLAVLILLCATPASAGDVWRIAERIDDLALDIAGIRDLRSPAARASRIRHAETRLAHLGRSNARLQGWNAHVNADRIDRLHRRLDRLGQRTEYGPVRRPHRLRTGAPRDQGPRTDHRRRQQVWAPPGWAPPAVGHDPGVGIFIDRNGLAIVID